MDVMTIPKAIYRGNSLAADLSILVDSMTALFFIFLIRLSMYRRTI